MSLALPRCLILTDINLSAQLPNLNLHRCNSLIMNTNVDHLRELNNLLQRHGLNQYLSWAAEGGGVAHNPTHTVRAMFNGQMIGVGTAGAVNAAKRIAAAQAIAWLNAAGYP
ncbi:hypothetical protein EVG20_g9210 [Dentipellis fragilis]|uniref:DRBM domain-containing protein n=1 Tax=Dentipellis fragilis TaxID=205917 RepID=A0A4Y9Y1F1_9AGAM|nr:hypothetical protein EVG20_g9210 [Dentipellis fragilis]